MDAQSDFALEMRTRLEQIERSVSTLSRRIDDLSAFADPDKGRSKPPHASARAPHSSAGEPDPVHKPRKAFARFSAPPISKGADWWLARAGAALTLLALILLYQYAVSRGWITPAIRVLTGAAIGAGLMHWGRKMRPAHDDAASPVALRELMMGSGLAAWYITTFAAAVSYHLISVPTARAIYFLISIAGGVIALNERRALLAIIAITVGFAAPSLLFSGSGSIPAYAFFLATLGGLSLYLYLVRGWQSILWISFLSLWGNIAAAISTAVYRIPAGALAPAPLELLDASRLSITLLVIAMALTYGRAPTLRRRLVATGSDRYAEPIRSTFARTFLRETGTLLRIFSPSAGSVDSLSIWIISLAAPLVAIGLLSAGWKLNGIVWGLVAMAIAIVAHQMTVKSVDSADEVTHIKGAAAVVWSLFGLFWMSSPGGRLLGTESATLAIAAIALVSSVSLRVLSGPRFVAATAAARLIAGIGLVFVLFTELGLVLGRQMGSRAGPSVLLSVAELLAIGAGFFAWREMSRNTRLREITVVVALAGYLAFLLLDARLLGSIWMPLVTASYAVLGTALLMQSRSREHRIMRRTGGATIALVVARLMLVDLAGVDTIWRVVLFLGCGALFLFTSYQMQSSSKQAPPGTA